MVGVVDYLLTKYDINITNIDKMVHVCCSLTNLSDSTFSLC